MKHLGKMNDKDIKAIEQDAEAATKQRAIALEGLAKHNNTAGIAALINAMSYSEIVKLYQC